MHDPLSDGLLIREAPRLPADAGRGSAGSSLQIVGFDQRGRAVGYWVPKGTAVQFVSTDVARVNGHAGRRR